MTTRTVGLWAAAVLALGAGRADARERQRADACERERARADACERERADACEHVRADARERERADAREHVRADACERERTDARGRGEEVPPPPAEVRPRAPAEEPSSLLHLQAFVSDVVPVNVGLMLGGDGLHALATIGLQPGTEHRSRRWTLGVGLGGRVRLGRFLLDLDLMAHTLRHEDLRVPAGNVLGQARLLGGLALSRNFALYAGPTFNTLYVFDGDRWPEVGRHAPRERTSGESMVRQWPGFVVGVQL
jgi:hypothetical protein